MDWLMKIDPTNAALYTDAGDFLKFLGCPLQKKWDSLAIDKPGARHCDACARTVHDTAQLTDADLQRMIANEPEICLKVSPQQSNCTIIPRALRGD